MGRTGKRAGLNCGESYPVRARNARHQCYCTAAPCKAVSQRARQAKWLAKLEHSEYPRGAEAAARVGAWRARHHGDSRRQDPLRDRHKRTG